MTGVWYVVWQMSNYSHTPSYGEALTPDSHSQSAGTGPSDYPFTMQQYPTTNYPSAADDYSLGGLDDPMSNSWIEDEPEPSTSASSPPRHPGQQQQQQSGPVVPDAVINMAAKVGSDKKPFAYIADVNDIRQQRDRVRRK